MHNSEFRCFTVARMRLCSLGSKCLSAGWRIDGAMLSPPYLYLYIEVQGREELNDRFGIELKCYQKWESTREAQRIPD